MIRLSWSLKEHCTGVLVGPSTVLTAAHCLYGSWGLRPPSTLTVTAGVSNYLDPQPGDTPRRELSCRTASTPATATGMSPTTSPCSSSRIRSTWARDVRAVRLPAAGAPYPAGVVTTIVGFGQQHESVETPTGALVAVPASILPQGVCGAPTWFLLPLNGVRLCAAATSGAACYGDSGSPLVTGGRGQSSSACCRSSVEPGAPRHAEIYTYVAAPEIRRFIAGDGTHRSRRGSRRRRSSSLPRPNPGWRYRVVSRRLARAARHTFATRSPRSAGRVLQLGPSGRTSSLPRRPDTSCVYARGVERGRHDDRGQFLTPGSRRSVRQGDSAVRADCNESVAGERLDRLGCRGASAGCDGTKRRCATLPERALEAGLPPQRLVAPAARGAAAASGQAPQRGTRARQIVAPRSNSAWAYSPSKRSPVRSWTRRTFVSTGSTSRPKAKLPTAAAVYGPTPGSSVRSSGQPRSATTRAARCRLTARRL